MLCPSVSGMNKMLNRCSDYAERHRILFNTNKNQVMYSPYKKQEKAKLYLKDENLKYVHSGKHLGHMLTNEYNGFLDVSYTAAYFNEYVNIMLAHIANVPSYVLCNIFI